MREQMREVQLGSASWLPYFTVESTDRAASHAGQLGGRRLGPTRNAASGHRSAVLADPQGAAFAVLEPRRMDGASFTGTRQ
jgi:uncharacterized protein